MTRASVDFVPADFVADFIPADFIPEDFAITIILRYAAPVSRVATGSECPKI
jgi:hypothetical protein